MKKEKHDLGDAEMRKEYDFSGGVRGKHYEAYRTGHTVCVRKKDGTVSEFGRGSPGFLEKN